MIKCETKPCDLPWCIALAPAHQRLCDHHQEKPLHKPQSANELQKYYDAETGRAKLFYDPTQRVV